MIYPVIALALFAWASRIDAFYLIYPLAVGCALLGPFAALGLYEISRRLEAGLDASWHHALDVLRAPALPEIAKVALMLLAIFLGWILCAHFLYLALMSEHHHGGLAAFALAVVGTQAGWTLILVGNAAGACFAFLALRTSVVAFPLLLHRNVSAAMAVAASQLAVRRNPGPMLFWGGLVCVFLLLGILTLMVGLIAVLPVLGHGTWHLYRKLVVPAAPGSG
nr:DUF2189 domain-containing protein [Defluviimonas salinarum]